MSLARPGTFWCHDCGDWTRVEPNAWRDPVCAECGEPFKCDECGFEVDAQGNCQRMATTGGYCPS